MKNKLKIILWVVITTLIVSSCEIKRNKLETIKQENIENFISIADTIISDVLILNPNEDEWTDYCLRNLDKDVLVNEIFKSVYAGDLKPFEFFHNTPLNIEDVKALEKDPDFSRDKIAKVQFEEAWYYDPDAQKMIKKVHSIMLAYEIYNSLGEIRGYKPAFKVYFK